MVAPEACSVIHAIPCAIQQSPLTAARLPGAPTLCCTLRPGVHLADYPSLYLQQTKTSKPTEQAVAAVVMCSNAVRLFYSTH